VNAIPFSFLLPKILEEVKVLHLMVKSMSDNTFKQADKIMLMKSAHAQVQVVSSRSAHAQTEG
jgi:hypothetical protein